MNKYVGLQIFNHESNCTDMSEPCIFSNLKERKKESILNKSMIISFVGNSKAVRNCKEESISVFYKAKNKLQAH